MEITMKGFTLKELSSVVNPFTPEARIGTQVHQQTETETSVSEVKECFAETEEMIFRLNYMRKLKKIDPHVIEDLDKLLEELEYKTSRKVSNNLIRDFAKSNNLLLDAWFNAYRDIPNARKIMKFTTYSRISSLNLRLGDQLSKITF
jgi:hypothetical protein